MSADLLRYMTNVFTDGEALLEGHPYDALIRPRIHKRMQEEAAQDRVIINGVAMSREDYELLREQSDIAPEWLTPGELQAAMLGIIFDKRLKDDPDGANFLDQLELTPEEIAEKNGECGEPAYRLHLHVHPNAEHTHFHEGEHCTSFCETEKRRRMQKLKHANEDDSPNIESHGNL